MEQVLNITKGAFNTLMKTFNKTCALCLFIPAEEDNLRKHIQTCLRFHI